MAAVTAAVVGIASAAVSATMAFEAAAKAKEDASNASRAAAKAMSEAKAKAEIDHYASLDVPLDAYEAEFEQNLAVAQQNTEALMEGDARQLAAGVGRIGAASGALAEETRIAMGEEISDLNLLKAESKDAINQQLIEMDVSNAREQNQRMRDSEALRASSIATGVTAVGAGLQSAASLAPLYGQSKFDKRGSKLGEQFSGQKPAGMSDAEWSAKLGSQQYSKKEYKAIKKQGGKDAFWDGQAFGWGKMDPAGDVYDPNKDYSW